MGKEYLTLKTVGVMYKCRHCKKAIRMTYEVESRSVDNEHPEWYLRKVRHSKRLAGGQWQDTSYFRFPAKSCTCGELLYGKAIDGSFNAAHPCDPRCTGATGHSCECSCGGANHGMDHAAH